MESDPFEEPLEPQQPTAAAGAAAYLNDVKTSTLNTVRTLVSQEKVRFVQDGFDLDLSYITDNIIALGYPAEKRIEAAYRNDINEVKEFFEKYHAGHYRIYNVSGKHYDRAKLNHQVVDIGWPDHHSPTLEILITIVEIMSAWLDQDPANVVAIHCKAGRGRTGTVVAALLRHRGICQSVEEGITYFASKRSTKGGGLGGVSVPSQKRYVGYFDKVLKKEIDAFPAKKLKIVRLIMSPIPLLDTLGKQFTPVVEIIDAADAAKPVFKSTPDKTYTALHGSKIVLEVGAVVAGDVLVRLYHQQSYLLTSKPVMVLRFAFHTNFHQGEEMLDLPVKELDSPKHGVLKDPRFPEDFLLRCVLDKAE